MSATQDLETHLQERRSRVEDALRDRLAALDDGCPSDLREAMRYSLLAPGKRLRPLLVILGAEACGGNPARALPAACAIEMVHTYSLIHDDLPAMDDDDLRRGLPTCHKKFGEALAILAGDALLTLAFEVIAHAYPSASGARCCEVMARAAGACGMVGGQTDDLAWENRPGSLPELERIHERKTGALIGASLQMGAIVSGDSPRPDYEEGLRAYGRCLGLMFQITDDLLDVEGDSTATGKRVQKDAARGKLTYPGFLGTAESRRRAERLAREAVEHLSVLGPSGRRLAQLADAVLTRNR